jgi:putative tricarboxylic transport membrane protein
VISLWRRLAHRPSSEPGRSTRQGVLRLAAALAILFGHALLLPLLGFTVSAAILFTGMALLLGSTKPWLAAGIGVGLAVLVFVSFTQGIGLSLPIGPWGF